MVTTTPAAAELAGPYTRSVLMQARLTDYKRLLTGEWLSERTVARMNLDMDPKALAGVVPVAVAANAAPTSGDLGFIDVTVRDPSPDGAKDIARVLSREFADLANGLERQSHGNTLLRRGASKATLKPHAPHIRRPNATSYSEPLPASA
jgi:capsular polysaccharide biosynthesis protein